MNYLLALLFGASMGVLFAVTQKERSRWASWAALVVILAIGVAVTSIGPSAQPLVSLTIGGASVVSYVLALGFVWRDHPLLSSSGYWQRVAISLAHERKLRREVETQDEASN